MMTCPEWYIAVGAAQDCANLPAALRQFVQELPCDPQVRRFKPFREAVVYKGEVTASLIALASLDEQTR